VATERSLVCEQCGPSPAPGSLFDVLMAKARGDGLQCPRCSAQAELHLRFSFGLNASDTESTVLDSFIPRCPEEWPGSADSKVTFYPFLVVLQRHGRGLATWFPYWHTVETTAGKTRSKYGQWAPFMDFCLFEDLLAQAQAKGYLCKAAIRLEKPGLGLKEMWQLLLPPWGGTRPVDVNDPKPDADTQPPDDPVEPKNDSGWSPRQRAYRQFYIDLLSRLKKRYPQLRTNKKIGKDAHLLLPSGKSGIQHAFAFRPSGHFEAAVYMDSLRKDKDKVKGWYCTLMGHRGEIERCFGHSLNWERLDHRAASRISVERPGSPQLSPEELDDLKEWALDMYGRFLRCFADRIQNL